MLRLKYEQINIPGLGNNYNLMAWKWKWAISYNVITASMDWKEATEKGAFCVISEIQSWLHKGGSHLSCVSKVVHKSGWVGKGSWKEECCSNAQRGEERSVWEMKSRVTGLQPKKCGGMWAEWRAVTFWKEKCRTFVFHSK